MAIVRARVTGLLLLLASPSWAADAIVRNGDTLRLGATSFRLDGIDAPELDQVCLDDKGAAWACGIAARDRLIEAIGKRSVDCDDKGGDPGHPELRLGICWVEGADVSLNQRLVREGWALSFEPAAGRRFKADQDDAQDNRRGLWQGCFAAPQSLRLWNKSKLLGTSCRAIDGKKARDLLFPDRPAMPTGCAIKGNFVVRAKMTGHRGVYHLESCRSYQRAKGPNRWFCSEDEARATGFRKSLNC
jgi:endonuclease YncB( thermonuclease family)